MSAFEFGFPFVIEYTNKHVEEKTKLIKEHEQQKKKLMNMNEDEKTN
jgi:hypothetical protein